MRKQPYPIVDITGGLSVEKDPMMILDKESPNLKNVRFSEGVMKKDVGFIEFGVGLPLDGIPMYMDTFYTYEGSAYTLVITTKWIYQYNDDTKTYTKLNNTALTGTADSPFSSVTTVDASGVDIYFLTNGVDPVMYWYGTGYFQSTSLIARRLVVYKNRLLLGNTVDSGDNHPERVWYSSLGDPLDFTTTPGSGYVDLIGTVDWITGMVVMKDRLFVIKERSIWEFIYVGPTTYFIAEIKLDGVGSLAPNTIIGLGEEMIFYGNDNVYLYDGISLTPIADQLFPLLYDTEKKVIDMAYLNRAVALYVEELEEYWISLPKESADAGFLLKYSMKYKSWVVRDKVISALGYYSIEDDPRWDQLIGAWSAQEWIWMAKNLPSGAPTTLLGVPSYVDGTGYGMIYEDNRITRDTDYMVFETKDFIFSHAQRWCEFRAEVKGGEFKMSYSLDCGVTWLGTQHYIADPNNYTTFVLFLNETSKMIRAKIESVVDVTTDLTIKWMEPWYIARERQVQLQPPI